MFDYPSAGAIAKYAAAQLVPASAPVQQQLKEVTSNVRGPVAAFSAACRLPAGSDSLEALWAGLVRKTDGVTAIPYERWDVDEYYAPSPEVGRMYVRHAAFINAECFDAAMFGISAVEVPML